MRINTFLALYAITVIICVLASGLALYGASKDFQRARDARGIALEAGQYREMRP